MLQTVFINDFSFDRTNSATVSLLQFRFVRFALNIIELPVKVQEVHKEG